MGREETRSAVMERGATALTIRGCALPVWAGAGSGDKGVGGPVGLGKVPTVVLDLSGREKYAAG